MSHTQQHTDSTKRSVPGWEPTYNALVTIPLSQHSIHYANQAYVVYCMYVDYCDPVCNHDCDYKHTKSDSIKFLLQNVSDVKLNIRRINFYEYLSY